MQRTCLYVDSVFTGGRLAHTRFATEKLGTGSTRLTMSPKEHAGVFPVLNKH